MADWSPYDVVYLRKLRIAADAYPVPLPRFVVETTWDGHVGMYDKLTRRLWLFTPDRFADPKVSAEAMALALNEYENEQRKEQL